MTASPGGEKRPESHLGCIVLGPLLCRTLSQIQALDLYRAKSFNAPVPHPGTP